MPRAPRPRSLSCELRTLCTLGRMPKSQLATARTGEPLPPNAQMAAGGSTVIAVHALEALVADDENAAAPLVYHNRTWHSLGEHSILRA